MHLDIGMKSISEVFWTIHEIENGASFEKLFNLSISFESWSVFSRLLNYCYLIVIRQGSLVVIYIKGIAKVYFIIDVYFLLSFYHYILFFTVTGKHMFMRWVGNWIINLHYSAVDLHRHPRQQPQSPKKHNTYDKKWMQHMCDRRRTEDENSAGKPWYLNYLR